MADPIGGKMTRSQYLAAALDAMGKPQQIQSAPQLGMDLGAVALLKQAQNRQNQGFLQNATYNQAANSANQQAAARGMAPVIPWNNLPTSPQTDVPSAASLFSNFKLPWGGG